MHSWYFDNITLCLGSECQDKNTIDWMTKKQRFFFSCSYGDLEVQDQGGSKAGFILRPHPLDCR